MGLSLNEGELDVLSVKESVAEQEGLPLQEGELDELSLREELQSWWDSLRKKRQEMCSDAQWVLLSW